MDRRQVQLDLLHETTVRHDESIRDLEYKHLAARHHLRGELLQRQHQVELSDQREYMQRAELEQKQRHLSETRQQPKNLKVSESFDTSDCLYDLWNVFIYIEMCSDVSTHI